MASPDPVVEKFPCDQGNTKILEYNMKVEMHKISFNEPQHRVVQSRRVPTPDVHISPA